MKRSLISFTYLLACLFSFSGAQSKTTPLKEYQIDTWTNIDGTPIERIWDIEQDKNGFLWLGSDRGLLRFDGSKIKKYDFKSVPILKTESIRLVEISNNGWLWFATRRSLYLLKNDEILEMISPEGTRFRGIAHMFIDDQDLLWFASGGQIYHSEKDSIVAHPVTTKGIFKVFKGKNKNWAVRNSESTEVFSFTEQDFNSYESGIAHRISYVLEQEKNELLIGTTDGRLLQLINKSLRTIDGSIGVSPVDKIVEESSGELWYNGYGLKRWDESQDKIEELTQDTGLSHNDLNCIFLDREGAIWIGTQFGLSKLSQSALSLLRGSEDLVAFGVNSVINKDGDLVIGTKRNGLMILRNNEPIKLRHPLLPETINSLELRGEEILISSPSGLFSLRMNEQMIQAVELITEIPAKLAYKSLKGDTYVVPENAAFQLHKLVSNDRSRIYTFNQGEVIEIYEDRDQQLWVATTKGLFVKKETQFVPFSDQKFSDKWILDIDESTDSILWFASYGSGLGRLKNENFKVLTTRDGMPRNNMLGFFRNSQNTYWQYFPNNRLGEIRQLYLNENEQDISIKTGLTFDVNYPLSKTEDQNELIFWSVGAGDIILKSEDGLLSQTANRSGIADTELYLDAVHISGNSLNLEQEGFLEADSENLTFRFSTIDFSIGPQYEFEYKLEGLQKTWQHIGLNRQVEFPTLPTGAYKFHVRARHPNGTLLYLDAPYVFTKKKFWYETGAAQIIYFLSGIGLIYLLFKLRVQNLKKQRDRLESIVTSKTLELKQLNENLESKVRDRTKELRDSRERYMFALEASNDGIFDLDVQGDTIKYSPAIYTMLGYEPYEFPESRLEIYKRIISEDRKGEHRKAHDAFLKNLEIDSYSDEYRMRTKDGDIIWISVKAKVVDRDDRGLPKRIVGTHTNITKDKRKTQELMEAVIRTETVERSRISKDIHDGLQQTLTIASLNFQSVKKTMNVLSDTAQEKFLTGWKYLQNSILESRSVAHSLMPKAIIDFGVVPAFENLITEMDQSKEDTEFQFYHNLKAVRLENHQIEVILYRILQEALNNIVKYAKASKVSIQLSEFDGLITLIIEDNGVGFDTAILNEERQGLGFKSMKNRLDAVHGIMEVSSFPGKGTTILVEINELT